MRLVLLSLFSREDNSGGLAVYDLDSSSVRYVQLVDFSRLPGRLCHVRGIHWLGDTLYAVSPFALFLFKPGQNLDTPGLVLEKTVLLREWLLGPDQQGNLHAVHASPVTNKVYVSFNAQGTIDAFDPEGNFLDRRHMWELASDYFPLPARLPSKDNFRFGTVRHMFEDQNHGIVLTTSFVNESGNGALLSKDKGTIILETPFNPHGSVVDQKTLYLSDIEAGLVHVYPWPLQDPSPSSNSVMTFKPVVDESRWPESVQNVRGMAVLHDRLLCGVCHFGKVKPSQIPPRLVEFDPRTGEQKAEHFLPSFTGLQKAQIYAVTSVPPWLEETVAGWNEPRYYLGDRQFTPVHIEDRPPVKSVDPIPNPELQSPASTPDPPITDSSTRCELPPSSTCTEQNESSTTLKKTEDCPVTASITPIENNTPALTAIDSSSTSTIDTQPDSSIQSSPPSVTEIAPCSCSPVDRPSTPCEGNSISPTEIAAATAPIVDKPCTPVETKTRNVSPTPSRPSIVLDHVGLCFVRKAQSMFGMNKQLKKNKLYWALHDVSFVLNEGESVGVIGRNGSGKSTLSLICAGVYKPDSGQVSIFGRVHLLALGVGFKTELTGRDNVFISASLLGLSRKEILRLLPDIEDFAELGGFIDEPVRTYSSGMRSKLGFAVATAVEPEILILDEAMSVGDKAFQDKAMARMRIMREKAKSVLVVSHNPGQLKKLCTRVVWMEQGRVLMDGEPGKVLHAYENFCKNPQKWLERNDRIPQGSSV